MTRSNVLQQHLKNKWFKRTLVISPEKIEIFDNINTLHSIYVTGFLENCIPKGCIFSVDCWPFDHNFFDLIILEDAMYMHRD